MAPPRRFTVEHGAAEVQRDPGARVLWPAVEVEEPYVRHTIACDNTDRELCDCADTPPPEPSR